MAHLERTLFGNPAPCAEPAADTGGLEVLAAASPAGEIEMIAARIKRLLVEGDAGRGPVRPGEIAVVFRHPQDAGGVARRGLRRLRHSGGLGAGPPLEHRPAVVALETAAAIARRGLAARGAAGGVGEQLLSRPTGRSGPGGARAAVDRALRRLQIPQGRRPLLERLQAAAESGAEEFRGDAWVAVAVLAAWRPPWTTAPAGRPGRLGARLAAAGPADRPAGSDANGFRRWSVTHRHAAHPRPLSGHHPKAWSGGGACFRATRPRGNLCTRRSARARPWTAGSAAQAAELDAGAALAALADIVGQPAAQARRRRGGPRASPLGGERPRAAGALPLPGRLGRTAVSLAPARRPPLQRGGVSAADRRRAAAGARTQRNGDEMLLFYEAVTRATRRLYLSYPALDKRGQPLLPSPLPRRGPTGVRPGRIARTVRSRTEPGAGGRGAFFGGRVPRQGGGHGPGGGRVAVGGTVARAEGGRRKGEGGRNMLGATAGLSSSVGSTAGQPQWHPYPRGPEQVRLRQDRRPIWSGGRDAHRRGGAAAVGGRFLAAANLYAPRNSNSTPPAPSAISSPRCWAWSAVEELAAGGGFPPARPAGARPDGRVSSPGQPAARRPGLARRAAAGRVRNWRTPRWTKCSGEKGSGRPGCSHPKGRLRAQDCPFPSTMPCAKWTAACCASGSRTIATSTSSTTPYGRIAHAQSPPLPEFFEVSFGQPLRGAGPPSTAEPLELDCGGAGDPHRRTDRPHRHRAGGRRNRLQRAGLQDGRLDAIQRRGGPARAGPATPPLRHGRRGSRAGRPRLRPLAGRLLVSRRQRLSRPSRRW